MKRMFFSSVLSLFTSALMAQSGLVVNDTRSVGTTPSSYSRIFETHFKEAAVMGLDNTGPNFYTTVFGFRGWTSDNSGGKAHELAFTNDGMIKVRSGMSPSWESWRNLVITNDIGNILLPGDIKCKRLTVKASDWPDYVFSPKHKLPALSDVAKFIADSSRLPGIPSAETVAQDGIEVGEINRKLLEKIEELTLYMLDMEKRLKCLESHTNKTPIQ